jgi:hypothetical protein
MFDCPLLVKRPISYRSSRVLDTQCHDRVDYIVVVLFQCLDSLLAGHVGLGHDKFDVLVFDAIGVHFLAIILLFLLRFVLVIVAVAGVVVLNRLARQLLGSSSLGTGVEVLDLGLAEDTGWVSITPLPPSP